MSVRRPVRASIRASLGFCSESCVRSLLPQEVLSTIDDLRAKLDASPLLHARSVVSALADEVGLLVCSLLGGAYEGR